MVLLSVSFFGCTPDPGPTTKVVDEDSVRITGDSGTTDSGTPVVTRTDTFPQFTGTVPQNLLIISIDTARRDVFERYGSPIENAPFLASMAASGVAAEAHRSCSNWTLPAMLCITTGQSEIAQGFLPDLRDGQSLMAPELDTIATRLAARGHMTMLWSANTWFSDVHASARGFRYTELINDSVTTDVFDGGLGTFQKAVTPGTPWYLHLHVKDPHAAYAPPAEYLDGLAALGDVPWDLATLDGHYAARDLWLNDMTAEEQALLQAAMRVRYLGEIRYMDDQIRAAMGRYDTAGLLDDTLVVVVNDHGEQFWEHDNQTHAYELNAEENDGFLFFWAKNIVPAVWTEPTSHEDIAPTVFALWGMKESGFSGLPLGQAPADRPILPLAAARYGVVQSVILGDYKMTYRWNGDKELYDVVNDPTETTNLYAADDPQVIALWDVLLPVVDAVRPLAPDDTPARLGP